MHVIDPTQKVDENKLLYWRKKNGHALFFTIDIRQVARFNLNIEKLLQHIHFTQTNKSNTFLLKIHLNLYSSRLQMRMFQISSCFIVLIKIKWACLSGSIATKKVREEEPVECWINTVESTLLIAACTTYQLFLNRLINAIVAQKCIGKTR